MIAADRKNAGFRSCLRLVLIVCLILVSGIAAVLPAVAQGDGDSSAIESRVKAAFLYKFANYVEWPDGLFPQPSSPITIGVSGADSLKDELAGMVVGRLVNDRPIIVKNVRTGDSLSGINILFIARDESSLLPQLVQSAQSRSILTVTESERALAQGSVINFVMSDGHVHFEISLQSADKSKLKLSSRLLAVAQQVTGTP